MKIDDRVSNYMALLNGEAVMPAAGAKDAAESAAPVETAPADVVLSSTAIQLADDEARRERLKAIRQQLTEGSYNISGKDVADKILNVLKG
ncbi:MAG: flagellar biosynthesis anti-sigma factor FlgM [Desulfuromonadaceae bacterium]